eukprot:s1061_g20.t1
MTSATGSSDLGGSRIFTGEDEDGKEYRRWRTWVSNKLLTLSEKMPATARGAFVYTMLAGKALEAVEHLDCKEYQREGGETVLFDLLDVRFPMKDSADELSENMTKIFELRASEGESLKMWISRASEAFELLKRKTSVSFPEEARGWIILNRSGLSAEQRAVVLARSQGSLKRDDVGKALRSCYPEFTVPKKKVFGAGIVADDAGLSDEANDEQDDTGFEDVEQFLADFTGHGHDDDTAEAYEESEIQEILAATWQERRKSLNKLQKARRFHDAGQVRRQFRVEVEELKRRTRCHRCNQVGHWSRECKNPPSKGSGKGGNKSGGSGKQDAGAASVEHFVAWVWNKPSMLQQLRQNRESDVVKAVKVEECVEQEQFLVSSPGFGVLDSGCGKTIVGEDTLQEFIHLWKDHGFDIPQRQEEVNHFRFGNGSRETTSHVISMPVILAGKHGFIKAAIVRGSAPLLISRNALKTLKAQIDFGSSELRVFDEQLVIPLRTNAAGQYVVYLLGQSCQPEAAYAEIMQAESDVHDPDQQQSDDDHRVAEPSGSAEASGSAVPASDPCDEPSCEHEHTSGASDMSLWCRTDRNVKFSPITGKQGPFWHQITRRRIINLDNQEVVSDEVIDHVKPKNQYFVPLPKHVRNIRTEFHFRPQEKICPTECLPVHQLRQVAASASKSHRYAGTYIGGKRLLVAEVFSPPRFAPAAESMGFAAKSYDLLNGFDFTDAKVRDQVKRELRESPPDVLVVCPPCTHEGGWWNLNCLNLTMEERLQKQRQSRMFIRFCCELYEQQISLGRFALFEHPKGARTWTYPEVKKLIEKCFLVKCHMCRYGLKLPSSNQLITKSTNLLVSHESMKSLGLQCPGASHPEHKCHDVIAGSHAQVGSISKFAAQYTPAFVEAVLRTIPQYVRAIEASLVQVDEHEDLSDDVIECCAAHREALQSDDDDNIRRALSKLHKNLGHPSNENLVRILRHGQASDRAVELARTHSCDFCRANAKPHVPLPSQTSRATQFNQLVGIDVKYLPGWRVNQKIRAMNIVDQSSCYQQMVPFYESETSDLLRRIFTDYWVRWAGPPETVILDPAPTNLGEGLQGYLESQGTSVKIIAAEAHWQLGRTESHGGWFVRILEKMIQEHSPRNKEEWEECVRIAHVKNQSIQSYGYTPHQHVFGKNPSLPGDLMSEPLHVVPGTAGLSVDAVAKSQALRQTARQAVVAMQDDKAMRAALSARPRTAFSFQPGDLVAYWRHQKFTGSTVEQGGRWHGTAVVIGHVGRNVLIAHRRQIFRCAPEQVRPATTEERAVIESPEVELLGIKDMIEGGTFKSKQYIDLVSGSYPTEGPVVDDGRAVGVPSGGPVSESVVHEPVNSSPAVSEPVPSSTSAVSAKPSDPPDQPMTPAENASREEVPSSSYGPIRRRVNGKNGEPALYRPPQMKEDDFVDMMKEIVPKLLTEATQPTSSTGSSSSPRSVSMHGVKRDHEDVSGDASVEPPTSRAKSDDSVDAVECMLVEEVLAEWDQGGVESLMAAYLQKKISKEIKPSGNEPSQQKLVDESKTLEWETLIEKQAVRLHYGKKAAAIKKQYANRFIGSRFVIIRKPLIDGQNVDLNDESTYKVKSRWCLQGHLDPDLDSKALDGLLQSPTLSQVGRVVLMQLLASHGWTLQLGDIKGAFMEAGPLPSKYRPLYASQPQGGIPGVPSDAVIEVVGNVYGQNDAPAAWYSTFDSEVLAGGWIKSKFDNCLYYLRDESNKLVGILGVHVDDTAIGGHGPKFEAAVAKLRGRFPYRKWRVGSGEFCGALYAQDATTKEITMSQKNFAETLKPASIPKGANPNKELTESQIKILRGINGSLNWLSSQSRPDLAVQTSLSQQCFPHPKLKHLKEANNAIRRARQHKDLSIKFQPISPSNLTLCCHSDAAWANVGQHTQAGYIIAFVDKDMHDGKMVSWSPAVWRSYKLPRAVNSTLGGESQAMATAGGTVEWLNLLLAEAIDGPFDPFRARQETILQQQAEERELRRQVKLNQLLAKSHETDASDGTGDWECFDEIHDVKGAMHDGAKRRDDEVRGEPPSKRNPLVSQAGYGSANATSPWICAEGASPATSELLPENMHGVSKLTQSKKIALPPDVPNHVTWGYTLIQFGMYDKKKMSYEDLRLSKDSRAVSYTKWCKARVNSSQGCLRDLAQYLVFMDQLEEELLDGPLIPQTNLRRQYKN